MSDAAGVSVESNKQGYKRQTVFLYILAFMIYLLPIRFGASWLTGGLPPYPDSFLFSSLPTSFLNVFSGALLIYGIVAFKPCGLSRSSTIICSFWGLITASCAIFGYFAEDVQFYLNSVNQMITVCFVGLSAAIALEYDSRAKSFIIAGLCGGLIHAVFTGVYQYLWGFADTQEFYRQQMAQGVHFPAGQVNRIMQKLVYSSFTISNSFAGHLVLTIPILVIGWKKYFNKENSVAVKTTSFMLIFFGCTSAFTGSNVTLSLITTFVGLLFFLKGNELPEEVYFYLGLSVVIISLVILGLTRSRAGMVCFVGGLLFAFYMVTENKLHKKCTLAAMACGITAACIWAPQVGSFQVRLGYYRSMLETFASDIWGSGFGCFASAYNRLKDAGIEESNVPHSFFFGYLGQGGLIAGLAVILCFAGTVFLVKRSRLDKLQKFCVLAGFSSWYFHAQLDFHIMIIGSLATVIVVSLLCLDESQKRSERYKFAFWGLLPIIAVIMYFNIQKIIGDRSYYYLYQTLNSLEEKPTLDKVKNIVDKVQKRDPYTARHFVESANWALGQYMYNNQINTIQKFEYLKYAENNLLRARESSPLETGIYVSLARVYKLQDNYKEARVMLDNAFEIYPFSPSAISLELEILREYRVRFPEQVHFHEAYLQNKLKNLKSYLGRLRFQKHLNLSPMELNSIMTSLEKVANEIVTEIGHLTRFGIRLDTTAFEKSVSEILEEARVLTR